MLTIKITSLIVVLTLFVTSLAYCIELPERSYLRTPLLGNSDKGRVRLADGLGLMPLNSRVIVGMHEGELNLYIEGVVSEQVKQDLRTLLNANPYIITYSIKSIFDADSLEFEPSEITGLKLKKIGEGIYKRVFLIEGIITRDGRIFHNYPFVMKITKGVDFGDVHLTEAHIGETAKAANELAHSDPPLHPRLGGDWFFNFENRKFWVLTEGYVRGVNSKIKSERIVEDAILGNGDPAARDKIFLETEENAFYAYIKAWKIWRGQEPVDTETLSRFIADPNLENIVDKMLVDLDLLSSSANAGYLVKILSEWSDLADRDKGRVISRAALRAIGREEGMKFLAAAKDQIENGISYKYIAKAIGNFLEEQSKAFLAYFYIFNGEFKKFIRVNPVIFRGIVMDLQKNEPLRKEQEEGIEKFSKAMDEIFELRELYLMEEEYPSICDSYAARVTQILRDHGIDASHEVCRWPELQILMRAPSYNPEHYFVLSRIAGYEFIIDITADQFEVKDLYGNPQQLGLVVIPLEVVRNNPDKFWMYNGRLSASFVNVPLEERLDAVEMLSSVLRIYDDAKKRSLSLILWPQTGESVWTRDQARVRVETLLLDMNGEDVNIARRARHELAASRQRAVEPLLDILKETDDWELMEKIYKALLIACDLVSIRKLQDLYFKLEDEWKKNWIRIALEKLMQLDSFIMTYSPKEGNAIEKTTFKNRLEKAEEYILGLIRADPGRIKVILDCCASDSSTTLDIAKKTHGEDEGIKIIGMDINEILYVVSDAGGNVAVFDSLDNLVRLDTKDGYWIRNSEGWVKDGYHLVEDGPDKEAVSLYGRLKETLQAHLRRKIDISKNGVEPDAYSDGQGNRIEAIYLVNPEAIEWAMSHNLEFMQGDFFNLTNTVAQKSVDIAIVGNVLGEYYEYYSQDSTYEALKEIGLTLKEGGRLIIGNNPSRVMTVDFQFLVYERKGDNLVLVDIVGQPHIWKGEEIKQIALKSIEKRAISMPFYSNTRDQL
ncbi:MAG: hypothetical protein Q7O04_04580 [Candidatus Omnitrophota bacterium]|nr:hypothetical protein [Candidatus Omnitrophota bacterium]